MDRDKLILAFVLNVKNCIDFLKINKNYFLSRKLHGAKKNLIRYLLAYYNLLEYKRVLQFNHSKITGHCMMKFIFDVNGYPISFHLPIEEAHYITQFTNVRMTSNKVRIIHGRIPVEAPIVYENEYQIEILLKLLNSMNVFFSGSKPETQQAFVRKLENYVLNDSPLKLSL